MKKLTYKDLQAVGIVEHIETDEKTTIELYKMMFQKLIDIADATPDQWEKAFTIAKDILLTEE